MENQTKQETRNGDSTGTNGNNERETVNNTNELQNGQENDNVRKDVTDKSSQDNGNERIPQEEESRNARATMVDYAGITATEEYVEAHQGYDPSESRVQPAELWKYNDAQLAKDGRF